MKNNIAQYIDHTNLKPEATEADIKRLCNEAKEFKFKSVCVNPCRVSLAKECLENTDVLVCTVIGFPLGANSINTKVFEAKDAIANGADEIDMVINIGFLKDHRDEEVLQEIKALKEACGSHILKVIVETCLLTEEEKVRICKIVTESGADFIKTSTGFSTGGATREDVKLFAENIGPNVRIKAAGGIASLEDAEDFLNLGASRLGTSRIVKIVKAQEQK